MMHMLIFPPNVFYKIMVLSHSFREKKIGLLIVGRFAQFVSSRKGSKNFLFVYSLYVVELTRESRDGVGMKDVVGSR